METNNGLPRKDGKPGPQEMPETLVQDGRKIGALNIPAQMDEYLSFLMAGISLRCFTLEQANVCLGAWSKESDQEDNFFRFLLKNKLISSERLAQLRAVDKNEQMEKQFRISCINGIFQLRSIRLEKLGRYIVKEELGSGAMGTVYKAIDSQNGQLVALKVLHEKGDANQNTVIKRFLREAQTLHRLAHPNIIPVYDFGCENDTYYYTMGFIEGKDLERFDFPLPYRQACKMIETVAQALHYAHQNEVVHRDIKPSNIIVDQQGNLWLTDFGLAKDLQVNQKLTESGMILGTPYYMAPENLEDPKLVDHQSDIYSLGAVLYQVLSGKLPFYEKTLPALFQKILFSEPELLTEIRPGIPQGLAEICSIAMSKSKAIRYKTASSMAKDLKNVLRNPHYLPRRSRRIPRTRRSFSRLSIVLALSGLLALLLGTFFLAKRFYDSDRQTTRVPEEKPPRQNPHGTPPPPKTDPKKEQKTPGDQGYEKNFLEQTKIVQKLMEQGNFIEAKRKMDTVIHKNKDNPQAYLLRAQIERRLENIALAIEDAEKAIELDPNSHGAHSLKGSLLHRSGKYAQAVEVYTRSLQLCQCFDCYMNRGVILCDGLRQFDQAIEDFQAALRIDPNAPSVYHNLAVAHLNKREFERAISYFDKCIALDKTYVNAYLSRGSLYCDVLKQYQASIRDFEQAISLDPLNYNAYCNRAIAFNHLMEYEKALESAEQAIQIAPDMPKAYYLAGVALYRRKQYEKAMDRFKKSSTFPGLYKEQSQKWIQQIEQVWRKKER